MKEAVCTHAGVIPSHRKGIPRFICGSWFGVPGVEYDSGFFLRRGTCIYLASIIIILFAGRREQLLHKDVNQVKSFLKYNMTENEKLLGASFDPSPFVQFEQWYKEHLQSGIRIPESVSLGTVSKSGHVSNRIVLLKDYGEKGFTFFTNYNSRKGKHLLTNNKAALLFYWPETGRQVRIEGVAGKVSLEDSETYFRSRPRESQIGAWASEQSSPIPDRAYLLSMFKFYENKFLGRDIERPPHWGGFRIVPFWFEFWQDMEYRLHDRIAYTLTFNGWKMERLAP